MPLQGGVELGVCMKRAMEEAGKPFRDLSPGEVATALRRFEVLRSHRVAHIINKSQFMALFFWATGFLVRRPGRQRPQCDDRCVQDSWCSGCSLHLIECASRVSLESLESLWNQSLIMMA